MMFDISYWRNKLLFGLTTFIIYFLSFSFLLTPHTYAALEYFGYYNLNGLDPLDSKNHIPEVGARGNTNVGHILIGDVSRVPEYLAQMRQYNMKAILNVFWVFRGTSWLDSWNNLRQVIQGNEDVIYGFYFDEPFWTGLDTSTFRQYTQQIRTDYPNKAVIAIEAYPPIENNEIPENYFEYVTDFGFDFYPTLYTLQGGGFDAAWTRYLNIFAKAKMVGEGKKIWLVPDGWNNSVISTNWLGHALNRYFDLAKATPEVAGMLVFRYDPGDNENYYTIQDTFNPESHFYDIGVLNTHLSVGKAIVASSANNPSPMPVKLGDANGDNKVDGIDYVVWLNHYNQNVTGATNGDFNNSGKVDGVDYVIWLNNYNSF